MICISLVNNKLQRRENDSCSNYLFNMLQMHCFNSDSSIILWFAGPEYHRLPFAISCIRFSNARPHLLQPATELEHQHRTFKIASFSQSRYAMQKTAHMSTPSQTKSIKHQLVKSWTMRANYTNRLKQCPGSMENPNSPRQHDVFVLFASPVHRTVNCTFTNQNG